MLLAEKDQFMRIRQKLIMGLILKNEQSKKNVERLESDLYNTKQSLKYYRKNMLKVAIQNLDQPL